LDIIKDSSDDSRHFCIFDELYSGTNPVEATKSAHAFLHYLSNFSDVDYVLTTHYTSICEKLDKVKTIQNYKMDVLEYLEDETQKHKIKYTYKIKKGISDVQGAIRILEEMDYPIEIIEGVKNYSD
jgi:DNA mismatch repair ATPase MutS